MVKKIKQSQNREILEHYVKAGEIIAEMFAPYLEVIIHDFQAPEQSIIAMGFNFDLSSFANIKEFFEIFTKTIVLDDLPNREQFFMWSVKDEIQQSLNKYISSHDLHGKALNRKDKLNVVSYMKKNGHINKKGAISILSELLAVTRPTLYKYIKEIS